MSAVPNPSEDHSKRDFLRVEVGLAAQLITLEGAPKNVRILDLSQGGARIAVPDGLSTQGIRDCLVSWLGFEAFGSVGRRTGNEIVIVFDEPLRPVVIKKTRDHSPFVVRSL